MADLGILVIHGTGPKRESFAKPLQRYVTKQAQALGVSPDRVVWQSVHWTNILKKSRNEYLSRARLDNDLDFLPLRELMVSAVGDSAAYQPVDTGAADYDPATDIYALIHQKIRDAVSGLHKALNSDDKPLMILAHSLGGHIISN